MAETSDAYYSVAWYSTTPHHFDNTTTTSDDVTPYFFNTTEENTTTATTSLVSHKALAAWEAGRWLLLVYRPLCAVFGVVGNVLSIGVVVKTSLRHSPSAVYMVTLAVQDMILSCVGFVHMFPTDAVIGEEKFFTQTWHCRTFYFSLLFTAHWDTLTLVAMTAQRYVAIGFPIRAARWNTRRVAAATIIIAAVVAFLANWAQLFLYEAQPFTGEYRSTCGVADGMGHYWLTVIYPWVDWTLYSSFPIITISIFNILIYRALAGSAKLIHESQSGRNTCSPARPSVVDAMSHTASATSDDTTQQLKAEAVRFSSNAYVEKGMPISRGSQDNENFCDNSYRIPTHAESLNEPGHGGNIARSVDSLETSSRTESRNPVFVEHNGTIQRFQSAFTFVPAPPVGNVNASNSKQSSVIILSDVTEGESTENDIVGKTNLDKRSLSLQVKAGKLVAGVPCERELGTVSYKKKSKMTTSGPQKAKTSTRFSSQMSSRMSSLTARWRSPRSESKPSVQLTRMLLCVSVAFLLLTSPIGVFVVVTRSWNPSSGQSRAVFSLFSVLCESLMYTNHAVNFVLYCVAGSRFRKNAANILCRCVRSKSMYRSDSSTTS